MSFESIRQQAVEIEELPPVWTQLLLVILVSAIGTIAGIVAFGIMQSLIWI